MSTNQYPDVSKLSDFQKYRLQKALEELKTLGFVEANQLDVLAKLGDAQKDYRVKKLAAYNETISLLRSYEVSNYVIGEESGKDGKFRIISLTDISEKNGFPIKQVTTASRFLGYWPMKDTNKRFCKDRYHVYIKQQVELDIAHALKAEANILERRADGDIVNVSLIASKLQMSMPDMNKELRRLGLKTYKWSEDVVACKVEV